MRASKLFLASAILITVLQCKTKDVTWTGWFADTECVAPRAKSGVFRPNNPVCAKQCILKGSAPVFISEQAQALFKIKDYSNVIENLGYHLEITGSVDEADGTISIKNVKQLSYEGASCSRPKKSLPK